MIFAARGVLVSLAFFATLYCPLSALVALITWSMNRFGWLGARSANLLFWLRISSFAVSSVVTVFLTFPSFWMMERTSLDEDAGTFVLAGCTAYPGRWSVPCAAGASENEARSDSMAVERLATELRLQRFAPRSLGRPSMLASNGAPAMLLVGIRNPAVMVSDRAKSVLSGAELQVAVRHEFRSRRSCGQPQEGFHLCDPVSGDGQPRMRVAGGGGIGGRRRGRGQPSGGARSGSGVDQALQVGETVPGACVCEWAG